MVRGVVKNDYPVTSFGLSYLIIVAKTQNTVIQERYINSVTAHTRRKLRKVLYFQYYVGLNIKLKSLDANRFKKYRNIIRI